MNLHSLLGEQPGSKAVETLLAEASRKVTQDSVVPSPTVKVYKDAVYHSYSQLGISFNYEPSNPLAPAAYLAPGTAPPDPSLLSLVAIHLYNSPTDKFATFPLAFIINIPRDATDGKGAAAEIDMSKRAHEVVQLLGEPEEKVGGGRQGNCWIGYNKSIGLAVDFAGSSWDDGDMTIASLTLSLPDGN
ncbi:hypothetical protein BGZ99_003648 [Dissophora globulifera]|uniref:Uncharacterized protein n=1 Tax=Dissophora globulifera TaxID=979702 RepID=A0A9P6RXT4_9FUNG|nr:hypothetical protein BGZ99_003648 [Dissophora globulifera]